MESARAFLGGLKDTTLPDGPITKEMPDDIENGKGLRPLLEGLALFIARAGSVELAEARRPLLDRLESKDERDIPKLLTNAAMGGDDMPRLAVLQDALQLKGKDIFAEAENTIAAILGQIRQDLQTHKQGAGLAGDLDAPPEQKPPAPQGKRDRRSWRQPPPANPRSPEEEALFEGYIRDMAAQNPDNKVDNKAIARDAREWDKDKFPDRVPDEYLTPYEQEERNTPSALLKALEAKQREAEAYLALAQKLGAAFQDTVGKALSSGLQR